MPFSYIKFLHYCNKYLKAHSIILYSDLISKFRLNNDEIDNLVNELQNSNYVIKLGRTSFTTTYKGKYAVSSYFIEWLFTYFVSILALVLSIFSLVMSLSS